MFLYWIDRKLIGNSSNRKLRIAGASEPSYSDFPFLKTIEWGGMICLQEKPDSEEIARILDIPYLHSPVPDFDVPPPEGIERIVEFYFNCQEKNPHLPVLIHCTAGYGRTGTILASLLVILDQINPNDAIKKVREVNPFAIETKEQEEFILNLSYLSHNG